MAGLRLLIPALLAFSLSTLDAAAQDYRTWDRNGDGVITRAEWRGTAQAFRERDWDRDGVISGDELTDQDGRQPGQSGTFTFVPSASPRPIRAAASTTPRRDR